MEEKNRKLRNAAKTLIERIELYEKINGSTDPNYKDCLNKGIEDAIDYIAKREFEKS